MPRKTDRLTLTLTITVAGFANGVQVAFVAAQAILPLLKPG